MKSDLKVLSSLIGGREILTFKGGSVSKEAFKAYFKHATEEERSIKVVREYVIERSEDRGDLVEVEREIRIGDLEVDATTVIDGEGADAKVETFFESSDDLEVTDERSFSLLLDELFCMRVRDRFSDRAREGQEDEEVLEDIYPIFEYTFVEHSDDDEIVECSIEASTEILGCEAILIKGFKYNKETLEIFDDDYRDLVYSGFLDHGVLYNFLESRVYFPDAVNWIESKVTE